MLVGDWLGSDLLEGNLLARQSHGRESFSRESHGRESLGRELLHSKSSGSDVMTATVIRPGCHDVLQGSDPVLPESAP